jgi:hypothetical protein
MAAEVLGPLLEEAAGACRAVVGHQGEALLEVLHQVAVMARATKPFDDPASRGGGPTARNRQPILARLHEGLRKHHTAHRRLV